MASYSTKKAPAYLIKRITAGYSAGYVLICYSNEKDLISRNRLPINKLIDFKISKLAYKAS